MIGVAWVSGVRADQDDQVVHAGVKPVRRAPHSPAEPALGELQGFGSGLKV